ncbi:hypothetical protein BVX98_01245, partial [bacterium F11]
SSVSDGMDSILVSSDRDLEESLQLNITLDERIPSWMGQALFPSAHIQTTHWVDDAQAKTVVLVQDAHLHFEAQKNIAALITNLGEALAKKNSTLLVGVEGADRDRADFFISNTYPHRTYLRDVAEHFLKQHLINGAEFAALGYLGDAQVGPVKLPFELTGVEDQKEYNENVRALKASLPVKEKAKTFLEDLQSLLKKLKRDHYSPALFHFDAKKEAFEKGDLEFSAYMRYLNSVNPVTSENARNLLQAAEWEEKIDFDQAERERVRLLKILAKKMTEREMQELVALSKLFKNHQMPASGYYDHLKTLLARHHLSLSLFPEMEDYISYVLMSDTINMSDLMDETEKIERLAREQLSTTTTQIRIGNCDKDTHLLQKLMDHTLIEQEWLRYDKRQKAISSLPNRLRKLGVNPPSSISEMGIIWSPFQDFYKSAMTRSHTMARKLSNRLSKASTQHAVLVVGGFHTDVIVEDLKKGGVSILVVAPKITDLDEDSPTSLDILTAARLPLDRLFVGERLFLPKPADALGPNDKEVQAATETTAEAHRTGEDVTNTYSFADVEAEVTSTAPPEEDPGVRTRTAEGRHVNTTVEQTHVTAAFFNQAYPGREAFEARRR